MCGAACNRERDVLNIDYVESIGSMEVVVRYVDVSE